MTVPVDDASAIRCTGAFQSRRVLVAAQELPLHLLGLIDATNPLASTKVGRSHVYVAALLRSGTVERGALAPNKVRLCDA